MPRIITLDIETSPILAYVWGLFKQFVHINQIHTDWTILSFSYKVLGEKQVHHHNTGGRGASKVRDDKALLKLLWSVLDDADIVIAQNGVKFDVKKINSRFLTYDMTPPTPYKVVDTMLEAKRIAGFSSNRLAWLSEILTDTPKSEHKKFPGFELWLECLADNPEAWAEMRKYNNIDIVATEKVYLRLRPYIIGHPNVAAYNESDTIQCPKCSSTNLQARGRAFTQSGEYLRYQCKRCGGWARGRYTKNAIGKRRALLSN
jgi:RNase P subunit RPR2